MVKIERVGESAVISADLGGEFAGEWSERIDATIPEGAQAPDNYEPLEEVVGKAWGLRVSNGADGESWKPMSSGVQEVLKTVRSQVLAAKKFRFQEGAVKEVRLIVV